MFRLVPFVLLLGSSVYGQAMAPMPPPPIRAAPGAPGFNPATDSPYTVGQPGHMGTAERLPRSPHKRYLPPQKEPGVWAGDEAISILKALARGNAAGGMQQ